MVTLTIKIISSCYIDSVTLYSGHSRGLRPLANKSLVQYCTSGETELYNDPEVCTPGGQD